MFRLRLLTTYEISCELSNLPYLSSETVWKLLCFDGPPSTHTHSQSVESEKADRMRMCVCVCRYVLAEVGVGRGEWQSSELNKIHWLSVVGPLGVMLKGGDDRGKRRASTRLHAVLYMCVRGLYNSTCQNRSCENPHGDL